jgi:MFS family permease
LLAVARVVRDSSRDLRLLLAGMLLLGLGQQLFVVLRNPWLVAQGWSPSDVPTVQALSAGAGVVAGLLGVVSAGRLGPRALLLTCVAAQALGFGLQLAMPSWHMLVLTGALCTGFAIQLHTAVSPPLLKAAAPDEARVAAFSAGNIALFAAAGLLGAGVVSLIGAARPERPTSAIALWVAVAATAAAALPFAAFRAPRPAHTPPVPRRLRLPVPGRTAPLVALHALLGFAGGITVPFLQTWFVLEHGTKPQAVAGVYAAGMVLSTLGHAAAPLLAARVGLWRTSTALVAAGIPLLLTMGASGTFALATAAFLLRHVANGMSMTLLHLLGQEVVPERDGRALSSISVLAGSGAWALGSALAGPLLRAAG